MKVLIESRVPGSSALNSLLTHVTSSGSDHSFINQNVTTSATPTFSGLTLNGALDMNESKITSLGTPTENTDATTKLYVDTEIANAEVDLSSVDTNINMNSNKITSLGAPTANTDATTKLYVDTEIANAEVDLSSVDTNINMNSNKITSLGAPTDAGDAATKTYVDSEITGLTSTDLDMGTNKVINLGAPSSGSDAATKTYVDGEITGLTATDLDMGTNKVINLGAPTSANDAATKTYVDSGILNVNWKERVKVATTANGTLATSFQNGETIDSVTLVTNDRILIKNQTTSTENGIYTVNASGAPTRSTDLANGSSASSVIVAVDQGSTNANKIFICTSNLGSDVVGTNNITFASLDENNVYTSGSGKLSLSTNTFDVNLGGDTYYVSNLSQLTAAFSSATTSGNPSRILVAPGTYTVTAALTLPDNCSIQGSGRSTTILKVAVGSSATDVLILGSSCQVKDMTFDASGEVLNLIKTVNKSDVSISNCLFKDIHDNSAASAPIRITNASDNILVSNCYFEDLLSGGNNSGVWIDLDGGSKIGVVIIRDCSFVDCNYAIYNEVNSCEDLTVSGCFFSGCDERCIETEADRSTIVNNVFQNNSGGIIIGAGIFNSNIVDSVSSAITLNVREFCQICSNYFNNNTGATATVNLPEGGVVNNNLVDGSTTFCSFGDIMSATGNLIKNTTTAFSGTTEATIRGNYISTNVTNPYSSSLANTPNVGASVGGNSATLVVTDPSGNIHGLYDRINVTTTTTSSFTLRDLTRGQAGHVITILFVTDAGSFTMTPETFANGDSISFTDAGDFVNLQWTGTEWKILGESTGNTIITSALTTSAGTNVTGVTVRNVFIEKVGQVMNLSAVFEAAVTASGADSDFTVTLPGKATNFSTTYEVNACVNGWYNSSTPDALANVVAHSVGSSKNMKVRFTTSDTNAHFIHVTCKYSTN